MKNKSDYQVIKSLIEEIRKVQVSREHILTELEALRDSSKQYEVPIAPQSGNQDTTTATKTEPKATDNTRCCKEDHTQSNKRDTRAPVPEHHTD